MHEDQYISNDPQVTAPPVADPRKSKQGYYRFPLSPPSSGTVTAVSSPRLPTRAAESPELLEKFLASSSAFRHPHSQAPNTSWRSQPNGNATDSDGYTTERSSHLTFASKRPPRKANNRALTLPASTSGLDTAAAHSPPKTARLQPRRSSSTSSSSSSSLSSPKNIPSQPSTAGIGRKVAATLQLFKETTPEDIKTGEPSSRPEILTGTRKIGSTSQPTGVAEAQFEFVKRSEWPDRETAAVRRERSSTTLERVRTRDNTTVTREDESRVRERKPSVRVPSVSDLAQWRKDVGSKQEAGRGRRRERTADEATSDPSVPPDLSVPVNTTFHEASSPFIRPRSRAYPPSPSPSRSPSRRISPYPYQLTESSSKSSTRPTVSAISVSQATPCHSRSPTPIQTQTPFPPYPTGPVSPQESTCCSPWSTDDESTWETASATTSTSTTSTHSPFALPSSDIVSSAEDQDIMSMINTRNGNGHRIDGPGKASSFDFNFDHEQENLPHIPLRPFRNQVGGHSAIYKFTKQAVCKVRKIQSFPFVSDLCGVLLSLIPAPCIPRKSVL